MAASTAASSNTNSDYNYQVFLNHHGEDCKQTLASHLYFGLIRHGFRVFLDKREMKVGDDIDPQIRGAIATSSVHIAIFSRRYAESKWCLKELDLMLKSKVARATTIIPVFYHVSTSLSKVYGQALCNLENEPNIKIWKEALSSVSSITGLELMKACDGDEGELVDRVVQLVKGIIIREIPPLPPLYVAEYPTGLDKKLEDFEQTVLLQQQEQHSESTKIFGIVGACGVGKATLARELFNRNRLGYDRSCVLFDVRDQLRYQPLSSLQNKLVKDLNSLNPDIDNIHEATGKGCKALVILDDVGNAEQLKELFSGVNDVLRSDSLILVTSCDKDTLKRSGIREASIYKLKGLDREQSRELFCWHAFHQPHPETGFEDIVEQFLDISDGLPLSLRELGGQLSGKQSWCWKAHLRKILGSTLPAEIQRRLKIGYDDLDNQEKEVFLDTACFFIEQNKDMAIGIWKASSWEGRLNLQKLENKFLLEIDSTNCIRMHDHIRDLGRYLAEKELPRFHRRIWRPTDKLSLNASLQPSVRGINRVQGKSDQSSYSHPQVDMTHLQLLRAEGDCLASISNLLEQSDLQWLCWDEFPYTSLPPWIPVKNSTVLQVAGCEPKLRHDKTEITMEHQWILCIVISCRPNPGQGTIAYVLYDKVQDIAIKKMRSIHGETTNNKAYYIALMEGLKVALEHGVNEIAVYMNSKLIIDQMTGHRKVTSKNLVPLCNSARELAHKFLSFTMYHDEMDGDHMNASRMCKDLLSRVMSSPVKNVNQHQHRSHVRRSEAKCGGHQRWMCHACIWFIFILYVLLMLMWHLI